MLYTFTGIGRPSLKTVCHIKRERVASTLPYKWGKRTPLLETHAQICAFSPHGFDSKSPKFSRQLGSLLVPPIHQWPDTNQSHNHSHRFLIPLSGQSGYIKSNLSSPQQFCLVLGHPFLEPQGLKPQSSLMPVALSWDQGGDIYHFLPMQDSSFWRFLSYALWFKRIGNIFSVSLKLIPSVGR